MRSAGPAGSPVCGLSGGSGSPGRSGATLTQCVGMRSSVSRNVVASRMAARLYLATRVGSRDAPRRPPARLRHGRPRGPGAERLRRPASRGPRRHHRRAGAAPGRRHARRGGRLPLDGRPLGAGAGAGRRACPGRPRSRLQRRGDRAHAAHLHRPRHVRRPGPGPQRSTPTTRSRSWASTAACALPPARGPPASWPAPATSCASPIRWATRRRRTSTSSARRAASTPPRGAATSTTASACAPATTRPPTSSSRGPTPRTRRSPRRPTRATSPTAGSTTG